MSNAETLKRFTDSHLTGDWETYRSLSTEDFQLIGPGPEPLEKEAFLTWLKSLHEANDAIDNNVVVIEDSGETVACTVQMEGTHTRDWDLGFLGLGVIRATNRTWKNPQERMVATLRDGKVAKLEVSVPEDGGIPGILSQLGVDLPG